MNKTAPAPKIAVISSWIAAVILLLVPFHAFLTVWAASAAGHYTLLRLWKEYLLVLVLAGAMYTLAKDRALAAKLFSLWLTRLILLYALVILVAGLVPLARHDVTAKAMWYGLLVDLRFLVFFLSVIVIAAKTEMLERGWLKLLFIPAIIVAAVAILQFLVLPYDFLKHFGYGDNTISPYETINHNVHHIRVLSTLRGANPLGAYLVVPISALAALLFKEKSQRWNKFWIGFGLVLALIFSFSRSAWIGAALAVLVTAWLSLKAHRAKRIIGWVLAGLVVIGVILAISLRNNTEFQNVFLHTQTGSASPESSNYGHKAAFKAAGKDLVHHPLGSGVGTAGPESVYNKQPARIAENYFLQIGQEAGWIGMLLFIAICILLGKMLYSRRAHILALSLLAALVGLSFVNLLSHAWTDDTLAYVYWGLAGIALSPVIITGKRNHKNGQKIKT